MSAILDTCVVSELYDVNAEPAVVQSVNKLGADAYLSVITIGEIFRGTQKLAPGRRLPFRSTCVVSGKRPR